MKSDAPDFVMNAQAQHLECSLVIQVDSLGIVHAVNGGLVRFAEIFGKDLRLPESGSSCFDFFASECEIRFEGITSAPSSLPVRSIPSR